MNIKNVLKRVDYKGLAIQHCEKAVIVVVTCLLVWFLIKGFSKAMSASEIKPDDIARLASALTKSVNESRWESSPDRDTVKNPNFQEEIEKLMSGIPADDFQLTQNFFKFVDFGAILRRKPDILIPYNALAVADRGAVSVYKTDSKGEFIEKEITVQAPRKKQPEPEDETKKKKSKSTPKVTAQKGAKGGMMGMMAGGDASMADDMRNRMGMGMGMSGMYGGGMGYAGMGQQSGRRGGAEAEDDESDLGGNIGMARLSGGGGRSIRHTRSSSEEDESQFADDRVASKSEAASAPAAEAKTDGKTPKKRRVKEEEVRGIRWVVLTALVQHTAQVKEFIKALHTADDPPDYKYVKVERRELLSDGTFSEWSSAFMKDQEHRFRILPPRWEPEMAALLGANAIFRGLVMPLPELVVGKWQGFNQRAALDAAKESSGSQFASRRTMAGAGLDSNVEDGDTDSFNRELFGGGRAAAGGPGAGLGAAGPSGGMMGMGGAMGAMGGAMGMGPGMASASGSGMAGMAAGMSRGYAGGQAAQYGVPRSGQNVAQQGTAAARAISKVQRSNAELVQIRFVDYTVEPEHTYQYRLKVVVVNPNHERFDVLSEDIASDKELTSEDWSEPSSPVFVPGDSEYYVLDRVRTREEATLQVHKWIDGDWQYNDFKIRPGDPIGSRVREYKLVDWDEKVKKTELDFFTHDLLLDVTGGDKPFKFLIDGAELTYNEKLPAEIFVVDRLGDLAIRNEDFDKHNAERKEREQAIAELRKKASDGEDTKKKKAESGGQSDFEDGVPTRKQGGGTATSSSRD